MEKISFSNNLGLLLSARKKVLNSFKCRLFPIKMLNEIPAHEPIPEPATEPETETELEVATEPTKATKATKTKTKRKMSSLKFHENVLNEIKNEEKNINEQIFNEFFNYHYPSFFVKDLYEKNQNQNEKTVKNINESLINLRSSINSKEIPQNENPKKKYC